MLTVWHLCYLNQYNIPAIVEISEVHVAEL